MILLNPKDFRYLWDCNGITFQTNCN